MSFLGSYRLLDAIENGVYTSGTLATALGTAKTKAEFLGIVNSKELLARLLANDAAVAVVLGDTTITDLLYAGDRNNLVSVLCGSYQYMKAVVASDTEFPKFIKVPGISDAIYKSANSLTAINNESLITATNYSKFVPRYTSCSANVSPSQIISMVGSTAFNTIVAISATGVYVKQAGASVFSSVSIGYNSTMVRPSTLIANSTGSILIIGMFRVGAAASTEPSTYYSTDGGYNWTASSLAGVSISCGVFGSANSVFVLGGHNGSVGVVYSTADGATLTLRVTGPTSLSNSNGFCGIAYNGGTYLVVAPSANSTNGYTYYSTNGTVFSSGGAISSGITTASATEITAYVAGSSATNFVIATSGKPSATAVSGTILRTTNANAGATLTVSTMPTGLYLNNTSITYTGSQYVIGMYDNGAGNTINGATSIDNTVNNRNLYSPDGQEGNALYVSTTYRGLTFITPKLSGQAYLMSPIGSSYSALSLPRSMGNTSGLGFSTSMGSFIAYADGTVFSSEITP